MQPDTETASVSTLLAGIRVPLWLAALLMVAAATVSAYLGTRWTAESLRAELTLRPPVILFDMAGAVRDAAPEQLAAVVARKKDQAKRLAKGGFLVLDAQAVIAAPPELYLAADAIPEGAGDSRR